ncbi:MAG: hypothetical protein J7518_16545 [Nocardioidaceae bacterium]|nr:hypothetical protein [Nocardioidaceae bacterium]
MSETNSIPKPGPKIERQARLRWVTLNRMVVSDQAQRELKQYRVDHLVAHFDHEQIGTLVVNERAGKFYIIDGQHRAVALREKFDDTHQVQCWTYVGLTEEEEAEKFLKLNDTLTVGAMDKYLVGVEAGRPIEADIDRIVRASGYVVSHSKEEGCIGAVGTLRRVYDRAGAKVLGRTLRIIDSAYGSAGMESKVIDGIGLLCARYNGELPDELAVLKLRNMRGGVKGLLGKAAVLKEHTKKPFAECVAAATVEVLNSGKGGKKLQGWWKTDAA